MAYIHESLYKTNQLGKIDFEEYVKELSKNLIHSYVYKDNKVSLLTETEKVYLDLDTAIPCGLIVNEIVSNSLKHGFEESESGIIAVFLKTKKDKVKLRLSDDGKGMPENTFGKETNSLGIQLIQTLVEQIRGELTVDGSNGTTIEITFPLN
jgi:two-component sensor histidine kinase